MAKQIGVIRLKGTIDGINYYRTRLGGDLARAAGGGFNSKDKGKPNMERALENATEFGHCSRLKKQFRVALMPFLCVRKDPRLHGRMMRLFSDLKTLDLINKRGERRVAKGLGTATGVQLLLNFDLTPECDVMAILGTNGIYEFAERKFKVTDFDVQNVKFPAGATHMALTLGLLHFDFNTLDYELKTSTPFYIDKAFEETTFELSTLFEIAVVGMKFYQKVEQNFYLFKSANAVGIEILEVG